MSLQDLLARRADLVGQMRALNDPAIAETRDLKPDESTRFNELDKEARALSGQIERAEKLAAYERKAEAQHVDGPKADAPQVRGYSVGKALRQSQEGRLDGLEAEWHAHLSETRAQVRGVMVPTEILLGGSETRALTTTTPAAAEGGNMVATDLASVTDRRRPALRVEQLGATVLRGLSGNLDLPRVANSGTAHWVSEHADTTRSDMGFEKKSMGPKTVSAEYELSRRMSLQSQQAIEPIMRADLAMLLAQAVDSAAIKGGGADEPTGLLSDPAITATASAGNDIGEDTSLLMQSLEIDDVFDESAFLTNPRIAHSARVSRDTTGQPLPTGWFWHGRPFALSTQVEQDGTDYPIIYGAFSNMIVGYWSGVDLLVNPYHQDVASKGGQLIHAFLDCDVLVRHPEAFAYVKRAL